MFVLYLKKNLTWLEFCSQQLDVDIVINNTWWTKLEKINVSFPSDSATLSVDDQPNSLCPSSFWT